MYFDTITDDERHIAHPRSALEFHVTYVRIHATPWVSSNVARALPSILLFRGPAPHNGSPVQLEHGPHGHVQAIHRYAALLMAWRHSLMRGEQDVALPRVHSSPRAHPAGRRRRIVVDRDLSSMTVAHPPRRSRGRNTRSATTGSGLGSGLGNAQSTCALSRALRKGCTVCKTLERARDTLVTPAATSARDARRRRACPSAGSRGLGSPPVASHAHHEYPRPARPGRGAGTSRTTRSSSPRGGSPRRRRSRRRDGRSSQRRPTGEHARTDAGTPRKGGDGASEREERAGPGGRGASRTRPGGMPGRARSSARLCRCR